MIYRILLLAVIFSANGVFSRSVLADELRTNPDPGVDSRFVDVRSLIEARVNEDIPSFAISVISDGEVLWEEAFGWADRENRIAATTDTMYSIASVSKSITSTGLMLLAERGDLDLDATLDAYLGDRIVTKQESGSELATVRDLMTMTAGFPMGFSSTTKSPSVSDRDQLLNNHGALQVFPPGEVFHYSNFSLGVAELVVEKATGTSFGDAIDSVLFKPLGMTSTKYSGATQESDRPAVNYSPDGAPLAAHTSFPAGGAGSYSSVSDLRRYASAHLGFAPESDHAQGLLSRSIRDAMHIQTTALSDHMFAAGWWSLDLDSERRLVISDGHGTGMAIVQFDPTRNIAVICLMNTRKNDPDGVALTNKVANQVFDILSPGFTDDYESFFAGLAETYSESAFPTSEFIGRWSGFVRLSDDSRMSLELLVQADGDIHVTLEDQYTVLLTETRFQNGILEGWFPGSIPVQVQNDRVHDILGRFRFNQDQVDGYLNANFEDQDGSYDLPNMLYLQPND